MLQLKRMVLRNKFYKLKSAVLALLVVSTSTAKLHDSEPYFNKLAFHYRMPVGADFVQLETPACLSRKVDEITCLGDVFTQGPPGFNKPVWS